MKAPVYVYYGLDNFYQNHRRYVKSKSDTQLAGQFTTDTAQLSSCDPLITVPGSNPTKIYSPCGLIAQSFFNGAWGGGGLGGFELIVQDERRSSVCGGAAA